MVLKEPCKKAAVKGAKPSGRKSSLQGQTFLIPSRPLKPKDGIIFFAGKGLLPELKHCLTQLTNNNVDINCSVANGDTALHSACYMGKVEVVEYFLKNYSSVINSNVTNNDGWTALHVACDRGHAVVVQLLLKFKKIRAGFQGKSGLTALHLACLNGNSAIVKMLLARRDVDINSRTLPSSQIMRLGGNTSDSDALPPSSAHAHLIFDDSSSIASCTPLHMACRMGHHDIVDLLLSHEDIKPNRASAVGWTPFHVACENGHASIVSLFLWYHQHCQFLRLDVNASNFGWTPLHLACDSGNLEICRLLLSCESVNPNLETDDLGYTPFHLACKQSCNNNNKKSSTSSTAAVVNDFIDVFSRCSSFNPASVNTRTQGNALHLACERENEELLEVLLKMGMDPNVVDGAGDTPLHIAASSSTIWRSLINANCKLNVNAKNYTGNTPLHLAVAANNRKFVTALLCCPTILPNELNYGWSPVPSCGISSLSSSSPMMNVTVEMSGKSQPAESSDGRTPLHIACQAGLHLVVSLLLQHPLVDVNAKSRGSLRPLHLVCESGDLALVNILLETPQICVNAQDDLGSTALHEAARLGHKQVVNRLLQEDDVDVNVMTTRYWHAANSLGSKQRGSGSALHIACENIHDGVARVLLRHPRVDPALATSWGGVTPLHLACLQGMQGIVERLLMFESVLVSAKQDDGLLPIDLAIIGGHQFIVDLLTPSSVLALGNNNNEVELVPVAVRFKSSNVRSGRINEVLLIGSFNDFSPSSGIPMFKLFDSMIGECFVCIVSLPAGDHLIQFVVDGVREINRSMSTVTATSSSSSSSVGSGAAIYNKLTVSIFECSDSKRNEFGEKELRLLSFDNWRNGSSSGEIRNSVLFQQQQLLQYRNSAHMESNEERDAELIGDEDEDLSDNEDLESGIWDEEDNNQKKKKTRTATERSNARISNSIVPVVSLGVEIRMQQAEEEEEQNQQINRTMSFAVIHSVKPDGPADWTGIVAGDVLIKINGYQILCKEDLLAILNKHSAGDVISAYIIREGLEVRKLLTLTERESSFISSSVSRVVTVPTAEQHKPTTAVAPYPVGEYIKYSGRGAIVDTLGYGRWPKENTTASEIKITPRTQNCFTSSSGIGPMLNLLLEAGGCGSDDKSCTQNFKQLAEAAQQQQQ